MWLIVRVLTTAHQFPERKIWLKEDEEQIELLLSSLDIFRAPVQISELSLSTTTWLYWAALHLRVENASCENWSTAGSGCHGHSTLKGLDQQHLGLWSKCGKNLQQTPCAAPCFCNVFGSSVPESLFLAPNCLRPLEVKEEFGICILSSQNLN